MHKDIDVSLFEKAVRLLQANNVFVIGGVILGYPHETAEVMSASCDYAIKLKLDATTFSIATPHPGTVLFDECDKAGLLLTRDWSLYDHFHQIIKTCEWPQANVTDIKDQLTRQYYFRSDWIQSYLKTPTKARFHNILARGIFRVRYVDTGGRANSFEAWQQIIEGYALLVDEQRSQFTSSYTGTVQLETELEAMILVIEKGRPRLCADKIARADLIVRTNDKTLNQLLGLMRLDALSAFLCGAAKAEGTLENMAHFIRWVDAFQDIVGVQWPWRPFDSPACLSQLCRLLEGDTRFSLNQQERQSILFENKWGNLLVRIKGQQIFDLALMSPSERPSGKIRNIKQVSVEDATLSDILRDPTHLIKLLADVIAPEPVL
jgi:hypothetical protein